MSEVPDLPADAEVVEAANVPEDRGTAIDVDVTAFLPEPEPVDAAQLSQDLDRVDAALAALDAKTYGLDPQTGQPIADELLAEDPTRLS